MVLVVGVAGRDWWMVLDLLSKVPEFWTFQLECFPQNRIERLGNSLRRTGMVLAENECADVYEPESLVFNVVGFDKEIVVLHDLCELLEHGERLVEVHRHGDSRQVLADRVLDDLPDRESLLWILEHWQTVPLLVSRTYFGDLPAIITGDAVLFFFEVGFLNDLVRELLVKFGRKISLFPLICRRI